MNKTSNDPARASAGKPWRLRRRTVLRGVLGGAAGVTIGLPVFNSMLNNNGDALAAGGKALRFGVFHWGNGILHSSWRPETTGTDWTLPANFARWETLKLQPYMTQFVDFNHVMTSPGHIPARGVALSSSHDLNRGVSGVGTYRGQNHPEPSLDALIAEKWPGRTDFDSLEMGINTAGPYKNNSSWKRGGTTYNRHEQDASKVFERLFSMAGSDASKPDPLLALNAALGSSMLDAVRDDAKSLELRLGNSDKLRLAQHLDGLRSLEKRFAPPRVEPQASCVTPSVNLTTSGGTMLERAELMADLLAVALACDKTRLFSFEWAANQSQANYGKELGIEGQHHEDISHDLGNRGAEHGRVITYVMDGLAYLADALRRQPEGDGNVLDNTLIFATSEHANPNKHDYKDHPLLFVGRAGGSVRSGQVISGGGKNDAPKVLLTAVRAVEPTIERLGQLDSGGANRQATETVGAAEA